MTRPFAAAVLALGLAAAASAAPIPKDADKPSNLFPAAVGSKWTYEVGDQTITVEATKVTRDGDGTRVTMATSVGDKVQATETYLVNDKGVYRVEINKVAVTPPVQLLPAAPKVGDAWAVNAAVGPQQVAGKFRVAAREKVEVPAGTYEAVQVEGVCQIAEVATTVRMWYAPGAGVVRLEYVIVGTTSTLKLKTYTPGK